MNELNADVETKALEGLRLQDLIKEVENDKELYVYEHKLVEMIFKTHWKFREIFKRKLMGETFKERFYHKKINEKQKEWLLKMAEGKNSIVRMILDNMTHKHSWILEKCYLDKNTMDNTLWYEQHFSKTTFYKVKREAVKEFVSYYTGIFN
ncbi:DUF1492 domain-containing protein [Mycoplasma sp. CSL10137]|uniref:MG284/MPN403 family protein n=1 Tax=Mycoplasma sp. CSL10137 TaxID=2813824 RepID=UPI00197B4412|nr:DUF1492 domain-containing protein [Mycoplasma sp. CSL10137]MBN4083737.1 DUF1492 domain-containing protein [Mycoplasma sp. CSL10137]